MKSAIATLLAGAVLTGAALAGPAQAVPVLNPANGHYYEHVDYSLFGWFEADALAQASSWMGQQGYLATITSADENAFVTGLGENGWLGGSDAAVDGEWRWVRGPETGLLFSLGGSPVGYALWYGSQPSGGEHYLEVLGVRWNDAPPDATRSYFVEFDAPAAGPPGIPEPASWALMIGGFGLAGAALRRRRNVAAA